MPNRETMEVDVLLVGAGPASLSCALHLLNLFKEQSKNSEEKAKEYQVVILEKGGSLGAHTLSGAILDPIALKELIPDFLEKGAPLEGEVQQDETYFLTKKNQLRFPLVPPTMKNEGNYVCTLGKLVQWLGKLVEEKGGLILTEVSGWELIVEDGQVVGVLTGDKGVDREGIHKTNYEPGVEIRAKVTLLGEGPLGTLTRKAVNRFDLQKGKSPQVYATSVKEIWELPSGRLPSGLVIHTMGYPLPDDMFGGGFIYSLKSDLVSLGLVVALNYKNPYFDTQAVFQRYKEHPMLRSILQGGRIQRYGAKIIPEGGYFAIPKLTFPGGMIIGDSAGLVNVPKLKGIHYAMKSGMIAAEVICEAFQKENFSPEQLGLYETKVYESYIGKDLYDTRYFKAAFHGSFKFGLVKFGLQMALGGKWYTKGPQVSDGEAMYFAKEFSGSEVGFSPDRSKQNFDEALTFKKLTDVYFSGTKHEENQPVHLRVDHFRFTNEDICGTRCAQEFGNPCQYFCPANVYEIEEDPVGKRSLKINAANCVHCKTCDVKDPYGVIEWVPPEGGGGPAYLQM